MPKHRLSEADEHDFEVQPGLLDLPPISPGGHLRVYTDGAGPPADTPKAIGRVAAGCAILVVDADGVVVDFRVRGHAVLGR